MYNRFLNDEVFYRNIKPTSAKCFTMIVIKNQDAA